MRHAAAAQKFQGYRLSLRLSSLRALHSSWRFSRAIRLAVIATAFIAALPACQPRGNWRELSVLIEDDLGEPVRGASVRGLLYTHNEQWIDEASRKKIIGYTDNDGQVEISILDNYIDVSVEKDGYYSTLHRVTPLSQERRETMDAERIRLRKRIDPVPMYAKRVIFLVEGLESGETYGYDFLRGDFVSPMGDGVTTDIELSYVREFESARKFHWSLNIRFANSSDGLIPQLFEGQGSEFLSGYEAPRDGYRNEWTVSRSRGAASESPAKDYSADWIRFLAEGTVSDPSGIIPDPNALGFYFRVRSEVDDDGNLVGGYYGKIYGIFPEAVYYLNPDQGNRNVEYDVSNNLFGTLPILERTGSP